MYWIISIKSVYHPPENRGETNWRDYNTTRFSSLFQNTSWGTRGMWRTIRAPRDSHKRDPGATTTSKEKIHVSYQRKRERNFKSSFLQNPSHLGLLTSLALTLKDIVWSPYESLYITLCFSILSSSMLTKKKIYKSSTSEMSSTLYVELKALYSTAVINEGPIFIH